MFQPKVRLRSSLQPTLDVFNYAFEPKRSRPRLLNAAASGSLKPPPTRRLRWTYHHLSYSIAFCNTFLTQPPTEPYVNLSIHTARDGHSPSASQPMGDVNSVALPVSRWQRCPLSHPIPFAPDRLPIAQRYYWMVRPRH